MLTECMRTLPLRCPCCLLPTLKERRAFERCDVCWWEDDGQDEENLEEVWGGPNRHYSLQHARRNFIRHGHIYDPGTGPEFVENPSEEREAVLHYIGEVRLAKLPLDAAMLNTLISRMRIARDN